MGQRIAIFDKSIFYLNITGNFQNFVHKFGMKGEGRESYSKCDLLQLCVDLSNNWDLKLNKKVRVAFLC